jgi:hypothetical protein
LSGFYGRDGRRAFNDPAAHARQVKDGYIKGVPANRPSVISVNMFGASLAVNEFLARLHPFREESNELRIVVQQ